MKYFVRSCAALGAVLLVVVLAAAAIVWRLSEGPVAVPFLDSRIREALAEVLPDTDLVFARTVIQWTRNTGLDLNIIDVRLEDRTTGFAIDVPDISLRFDPLELLAFNIAPTGIRITGAMGVLQWSAADIRDSVDGSDAPSAATATTDPGLIFIRRFLTSPDQEGLIGQLERVRLTDAHLILTEEKSGTIWQIKDIELVVERSAKGADITASARLGTAAGYSDISFALPAAGNGRPQQLTLGFMNINPAGLMGDIDEAGALAAIDMPVSGVIRMGLSGEKNVDVILFDVTAGVGSVNFPDLYENPPRIEQVALTGRYNVADRALELDRITAYFGGAEFTGDGVVVFLDAGPEIHFMATLENMDLRKLLDYWPASAAPGGRLWIDQNIPEGFIPAAKIWIALTPEMLAAGRLPEEAMQVSFSFERTIAHYLRPMPPVTGGSGTGRLTPDRLVLNIEAGEADGIRLSASDVVLNNLQEKGGNMAEVRLRISAPVPDILRLIDYQPLGYATRYGISPGDISGNAVTVTQLKFPLIKALKLDQIEVNVDAGITSLTIPDLLTGDGLTDGRLAMKVTVSGLDANGVVMLNGVPFELVWSEDFTTLTDGQLPSHYHLTGAFDAAKLANFGMTFGTRIQGPLATDILLRGNGPEIVDGQVKVVLNDAVLRIEELNWEKPAGVAMALDFPVEWIDDRVLIAPLKINQADAELDANFAFDRESGEFRAATISHLVMGDNRFSALISRPAGARLSVDVTAESFDAREFLRSIFESDPNVVPMPPIQLQVRAERVVGLNDVLFTNMTVTAENEGDYWRTMDIAASLDSGESLLLTISPNDDHRHMSITSADAGRTALGLGIFVNAENGTLDLSADLIGRGDDLVVTGELKVEDFRMVKSSSLVQAVELGGQLEDQTDEQADGQVEGQAEGQGNFDDHISKRGIRLKELVLPFEIRNGIIDISNARANGPSIGFTMEGQVDQGMERVNMSGVIVPMYMLNNILGKIPLVGSLLMGGKGEGLFAITYRIEGDADDPDVTVNPLSAIAPGFLRKVFEGKKGTIEVPDNAVGKSPPKPESDIENPKTTPSGTIK